MTWGSESAKPETDKPRQAGGLLSLQDMQLILN